MQHRNITITGKVQGVFFRSATCAKAHALGVKGRVCNRPDGSVFVEAEAPAALLDEFHAWLHLGPPAARVEQVTAVAGDVKGYHDFEIG
jgi:acylphosphatase